MVEAWLNLTGTEVDSSCGDTSARTVVKAMNGTDYWYHTVNHTHWFIIDLGETYTITKVRGRSSTTGYDPTDVNIYVSDSKVDWGVAVATGINTWQDTAAWQEVDTTDKDGRYIKIEIVDTENASNYIKMDGSGGAIFDAYGEVAGETHTPGDTAKASDGIVFDVEHPFADDANASDSLVPAVEHPFADNPKASDSLVPAVTIPFADDANATDSLSYKIKHSIADIAKASDSFAFIIKHFATDVAKAIDSLIPVVTYPTSDNAKASDSFAYKVKHFASDIAKASDGISFYEFVAYAIGDTAKAVDALITAITHPFSDNPKASDSRVEAITMPLEDTAKASDSFAYKVKHFASDTAKALDSLTFSVTIAISDIAKAIDSMLGKVLHTIADTAKASDVVEYVHPFPPYPCGTFTLYGTASNILFPKPEWNSPDNGITKNIGLFNFRSGRLSTVDKGIETQPLTLGGVVSLYEHEVIWEDLAAMTTWLNGIKTAMNSGEKFTINELGNCLNGVYVINDFKFDTIVGTVDTWSWSLHLERVKDV